MDAFVPSAFFLTRGVGRHRDRLGSFELALRDAGIEKQNLVQVSSIVPPRCVQVSRERGTLQLRAGQISYAVMARMETDEPHRLIAASVGVALPADRDAYGYLSEHHGYGQTDEAAGDYAQDLAASMLANTMGLEFDADTAWDERRQLFQASGLMIKTTSITQSATGDKTGLWTAVVAAAVFLP
jgi:arginine decarboxylase